MSDEEWGTWGAYQTAAEQMLVALEGIIYANYSVDNIAKQVEAFAQGRAAIEAAKSAGIGHIKIERSSGNVFADLGLPDAEALLAEAQRKLR